MIPTMLLAGLLVGLLPIRGAIAGTLLLSALWASAPLLGWSGATVSSVGDWTGAFIFGAGNAAAGAAVSQMLRITVTSLLAQRRSGVTE